MGREWKRPRSATHFSHELAPWVGGMNDGWLDKVADTVRLIT